MNGLIQTVRPVLSLSKGLSKGVCFLKSFAKCGLIRGDWYNCTFQEHSAETVLQGGNLASS